MYTLTMAGMREKKLFVIALTSLSKSTQWYDDEAHFDLSARAYELARRLAADRQSHAEGSDLRNLGRCQLE